MAVWGRGRDGWDKKTTVVAFESSPEVADAIAVSSGPCVIQAGQDEPLVNPSLQDGREIPRQTAALFTVLTGQVADGALIVLKRENGAQISRASNAFLGAMADECEHQLRLGEEDDAVGDKDLTRFTSRRDELDRAWLKACAWERGLRGTGKKLHRLGIARSARMKGLDLYFWHGPPVPMKAVTSGSGPLPGAEESTHTVRPP